MKKKILNASEMGRKGALSRLKKMTKEQRSEWAIQANKIRWAKARLDKKVIHNANINMLDVSDKKVYD